VERDPVHERETRPDEAFRQPFLVGLTIGISILFLVMIRQFLAAVLLAAMEKGNHWLF